MMSKLKKTFIAPAVLLLLGCLDLSDDNGWTILENIEITPSPENDLFVHPLYMGAGGAAGSTENRLILTQESTPFELIPETAIELARLGHGCIETEWKNQSYLQIRHCTTRSKVEQNKTLKFLGRDIKVEVQYADACPGSKFYTEIEFEDIKSVCENLSY